MSDDWQVVEEALPSMEGHEPNCPCSVGRAHAALARLRERSKREESAHDLESEMLTVRYQQAEAEVARLREREAWLEGKQNMTTESWYAQKARAEAAEARVAEVERDWDKLSYKYDEKAARVAELEDELRAWKYQTRRYGGAEIMRLIHSALAHKEEK